MDESRARRRSRADEEGLGEGLGEWRRRQPRWLPSLPTTKPRAPFLCLERNQPSWRKTTTTTRDSNGVVTMVMVYVVRSSVGCGKIIRKEVTIGADGDHLTSRLTCARGRLRSRDPRQHARRAIADERKPRRARRRRRSAVASASPRRTSDAGATDDAGSAAAASGPWRGRAALERPLGSRRRE